jgi:hypothetical protein
MRKRDFINAILVISYIVCIVLFFAFARAKRSEDSGKVANLSSVRFCNESDQAAIADNSELLSGLLSNITEETNILIGKPCQHMKILENFTDFSFSSVS